jgi:hypothetical protein
MKKITLLLTVMTVLVTGLFAFKPPIKISPAKVHIVIDIARPKFNCLHGLGLCVFSAEFSKAVTPNTTSADVSLSKNTEGSQLVIYFDKPLPSDALATTDFILDNDVVVDNSTASQFGRSSIVLKKGAYNYNSNDGPYGSVTISAAVK